MDTRHGALITAVLLALCVGLPAQTKNFPVDEIRPGMVGTGRTVFDGDPNGLRKAENAFVLRTQVNF